MNSAYSNFHPETPTTILAARPGWARAALLADLRSLGAYPPVTCTGTGGPAAPKMDGTDSFTSYLWFDAPLDPHTSQRIGRSTNLPTPGLGRTSYDAENAVSSEGASAKGPAGLRSLIDIMAIIPRPLGGGGKAAPTRRLSPPPLLCAARTIYRSCRPSTSATRRPSWILLSFFLSVASTVRSFDLQFSIPIYIPSLTLSLPDSTCLISWFLGSC